MVNNVVVVQTSLPPQVVTLTSGSKSLISLTDTPSTYAGQGGKVVSVNVGETGVEFTTATGVTDHTLLTNIGTNTHAQIDTALGVLANTTGTNTGDQTITLTGDVTGSGTGSFATTVKSIKTIQTAGENLVAGDLVYLKADGKYWKIDASAEATTKGDVLLCNATILANNTGEFIEFGEYTTTGLTAGDTYYASETAGLYTNVVPTTTLSIVRIIGYALSTTVLKFKPDQSYVENV